jgi:hypothetical protein
MTVMNCWVDRQHKSAHEVLESVHKPFSASRSLRRPSLRRGSSQMLKRISNALGRPSAGAAASSGVSGEASSALQSLPEGKAQKPALGKMSSRAGRDMLSRMSVGANRGAVSVRCCCCCATHRLLVVGWFELMLSGCASEQHGAWRGRAYLLKAGLFYSTN